MNPMMTPDQVLQQYGAQQQAAAAPAPVAHSGNFLTHLLPTIGGIGGSILGGIATAGLGGEVAGGAGGAAVGKALENALEGKAALQGSDVTAGLEGGMGAGVGGIAGRALGRAGEALGNRGTNIAATEAENKASQDAIDTAANTYKDVPPQLQKVYNAGDSLAHAANMGVDVSNPSNLVELGNTSNDVLNSALDKALADSGPLDLSNYSDIVKDAIAKEGGTLGSFDKVALSRGKLGYANTPAAGLLQQLENVGAGVTKTHSDPNEVRTLTTKLFNMAQDAKPTVTQATGAIDPTQRSIYNVINDVRDQVKSSLYDRPEINDTLTALEGNLTPEDVGTQQLADHLNGVLSGAGKGSKSAAQDLLSEIQRNINVSNLGHEGEKVSQIVTSTGAKARAAAAAGLGQAGAAETPVLDVAGHFVNPHMGIASKVMSGVVKGANNPNVLNVMSRIGGLGEKLAPSAGIAAATAPNLGADPVAMAQNTGAVLPGGANGTMGGAMQNNTGNYLNSIEALSVLDPRLYGGMGGSLLGQAPFLQRNQLAQGELAGLPAAYANAGGAQGTGGILSRISALVPGTSANTYQSERDAAAHQLAQVMGISPQAAAGLLPQLMQNPNSAAVSSGILGNMQGNLVY